MPKNTTPALSKASQKKTRHKSSKSSSNSKLTALAMCPTNGAGWCPYPFSVKELERRMKAKAEAVRLKNQ